MKATNYKIIEHPNRWRLVYLDVPDKASVLQMADLSAEITILKPTIQMCCIYMSRTIDSKCDCDGRSLEVRACESFFG